MSDTSPDKLSEIFRMQKMLNDYVFQKKDIRNRDGELLTMEHIMQQANSTEALGPNTDVNHWLSNYLTALDDESRELREELLWKWWSKDHLDMQNIRVEIVDQLHFWMSLAMTAGMDADKVYDIYLQKNKINLERQDKDYNKSSKTEDDNKGIH